MLEYFLRADLDKTSIEDQMKDKLHELLAHDYSEKVKELLDLNISTLAKFLFLCESFDGVQGVVRRLSREEKECLLKEVEKIEIDQFKGRKYIHNLITELCS